MCLDPASLAIIGAVAMTAGGGMQALGQKKADDAAYRRFNHEQDRQKGLEADQIQKFQDSLDSTQQVLDPAAQAAAEARRRDALMSVTKGSSPGAGAYLPGASSAAPVVKTHATEAGHAADAATSGLANALAVLGGMGDLMQNNDINISHNSQAIDMTRGFRAGSLDALQAEMDAAKKKGQTLRTLGGLAQTIGQMALTSGMGGMGGIPSPDLVTPMNVSVAGQVPLESMPGAFI